MGHTFLISATVITPNAECVVGSRMQSTMVTSSSIECYMLNFKCMVNLHCQLRLVKDTCLESHHANSFHEGQVNKNLRTGRLSLAWLVCCLLPSEIYKTYPCLQTDTCSGKLASCFVTLYWMHVRRAVYFCSFCAMSILVKTRTIVLFAASVH